MWRIIGEVAYFGRSQYLVQQHARSPSLKNPPQSSAYSNFHRFDQYLSLFETFSRSEWSSASFASRIHRRSVEGRLKSTYTFISQMPWRLRCVSQSLLCYSSTLETLNFSPTIEARTIQNPSLRLILVEPVHIASFTFTFIFALAFTFIFVSGNHSQL